MQHHLRVVNEGRVLLATLGEMERGWNATSGTLVKMGLARPGVIGERDKPPGELEVVNGRLESVPEGVKKIAHGRMRPPSHNSGKV